MEQGFTHLFLVPAEGGTARAVTSGHWNVGARFDGLNNGAGYDWTPDGRTIVFDGLRDSTWDRQYQVSRVYALDVASGTIKSLVSRPGFWANPVASPDGRRAAFSGNDSTEPTHRTSDLWVMGIDGSGVRDVSKSFDRDPGDLHWAPDGKGVFFQAGDRGSINVHYADLAGGVRDVTQGAQAVSLASLARTVRGVGVAGDPGRLDRLRRRVFERDRPQLSRSRLRRSHGRRGRGDRERLRGYDAHVRLGLLRRRRALELGDRPHRPVRGGRGALPGDRLDQHGGADRHPALHLQLLPSGILGQTG